MNQAQPALRYAPLLRSTALFRFLRFSMIAHSVGSTAGNEGQLMYTSGTINATAESAGSRYDN